MISLGGYLEYWVTSTDPPILHTIRIDALYLNGIQVCGDAGEEVN